MSAKVTVVHTPLTHFYRRPHERVASALISHRQGSPLLLPPFRKFKLFLVSSFGNGTSDSDYGAHFHRTMLNGIVSPLIELAGPAKVGWSVPELTSCSGFFLGGITMSRPLYQSNLCLGRAVPYGIASSSFWRSIALSHALCVFDHTSSTNAPMTFPWSSHCF